jgi:hypothetical protein
MMVSGSGVRQVPRFLLCGFGGFRRAVFEAEAVVSGFEDVTSVPSNLTTTGLPEADDRPGSGSIELFMADAARLKSRESASTTRLYAKSTV